MADQGANLDYLIHIYPSMQTTKPRTSLGKLSTINYLLKIYQKHSVSCCIVDTLERCSLQFTFVLTPLNQI